MFEKLPKPIFYYILESLDSRDIHRLKLVSRFFNKRLSSDEYWAPRLKKTKNFIQKRHKGVSDINASLAAAAYLGLTNYISHYLKKRADVNAKLYFYKDRDMYINPIHLAAHSGNLACVKLLMSKKAIIEPKQKLQDTPLHWAVASGSVRCAQYFIDKGIDIEHTSGFSPLGWNWTALQIAAAHGSIRCVELLIAKGANIHFKDPDQYQAIHRAAWDGHLECLRLLIRHKADVNACNEDGITPIDLAASHGHALCVKELLMHGADSKSTNWLDRFALPLQKAISKGDYGTAKVLLEFDPTSIDAVFTDYGSNLPIGDKTALHIAASKGNVRAVQFLLQYNPDPAIECYKGKNALDYAKESGNDECIEIVRNYFESWQISYSPIM